MKAKTFSGWVGMKLTCGELSRTEKRRHERSLKKENKMTTPSLFTPPDPRGADIAKAIKARWVPAQSAWVMNKRMLGVWQRLYDAGFTARRYNGRDWFTLPDADTRYDYWQALKYVRELAKKPEEVSA